MQLTVFVTVCTLNINNHQKAKVAMWIKTYYSKSISFQKQKQTQKQNTHPPHTHTHAHTHKIELPFLFLGMALTEQNDDMF